MKHAPATCPVPRALAAAAPAARSRRPFASAPRALAAIALLAILALALAACADAGTSGSSTDSPTSTADPAPEPDGTPLLEFLASQDLPDAADFADLDPASVTRIVYSRDQCDYVETTDPAQIAAIMAGLAQIQVPGPYQGDEYATDSMETVTIARESADPLTIRFDFGKLVIGDAYYDTSHRQAFTAALMPLTAQ